MFSEEQIEEFKKIYEEEFGERISTTEAIYQAAKLINIVKIIYKPPLR